MPAEALTTPELVDRTVLLLRRAKKSLAALPSTSWVTVMPTPRLDVTLALAVMTPPVVENCALSMVELLPVYAEAEQEGKLARELWHLGESDEANLRLLIERHAQYTGSQRARQILDDWASYRPKFVKVSPNEYKRALGELAAKGRKLAA